MLDFRAFSIFKEIGLLKMSSYLLFGDCFISVHARKDGKYTFYTVSWLTP